MTGPDGSVPLRPGALRALLRQPDLPPDLIAKISARADHLARAEQRDAAVRGWSASLSRLPIIVAILMAFVVAAGVAFTLFPVPPEAGLDLPSPPENAPLRPAVPAPGGPMEATPPGVDSGAQPVADAANATPATDIGKAEVRPASSGTDVPSASSRANEASGRAMAPQATAVARPASMGGPSKDGAGSKRQSMGKGGAARFAVTTPGPASTSPALAPSAGDMTPSGIAREANPPVTVDVPVAVPVIDLSAQP